jgi:hypothetical protein
MATNNFSNIPEWILTGSVSQPTAGYSKIYPKKGETSSWYIIDEVNSEKRLALDYYIGSGLSQSLLALDSKYGYRLDVLIGAGLTYASGPVQNAVIEVKGITPSMLAITGSFTYGYILSTSTQSGEFVWIPNNAASIRGDVNRVAKFSGPNSVTSSMITDTGVFVYVGGYTPSNTGSSFSVDNFVNIGSGATNSRLYFGDSVHHYIEKQSDNGFVIRTEDEFRVDHYTNSINTYKVIDFDSLGDENRSLKLMDGLLEVMNFTSSSYISASNVNSVRFGKTQSNFQLHLLSSNQGALRLQDGGQASYSILYSEADGVAKWGRIFGYNGLTASDLGVGLNLSTRSGLTISGGTFGFDYTKLDYPLTASSTGTISIATVSVVTGVTYGSAFFTPTFQLDQWGRIVGIATVSTTAFTGPQGPTGVSFTWQGTYATSSTYSLYNVIEYEGSSYISLGTSSPGLTPSTITQSWALMASKGTTGPQGPTGISFTWQGTYATSSTYSLYSVVYYGGSSYISVTTSNLGNTPSTATMSWNLMAAGGAGSSGLDLITATFGDMLVYGLEGWTAVSLGPSGSYLYSLGTESNLLPIWVTYSPGSVLTRNFDVNLSTGKYFGSYDAGLTIPSQGWTIEKFIFMVLNESLDPTVTLIVDEPAAIPYYTDIISVTLSFDYTINNVLESGEAATFSRGVLEWNTTGGPTDIWNPIWDTQIPKEDLNSNDQDLPLRPTYPQFTFNYDGDDTFEGRYYFKYTVTDTKGSSKYKITSIDVTDYLPPDVILNVAGQSIDTDSGETNLLREKGNVASSISGSANRQTELRNLNTWSFQWTVNGGAYSVLNNGNFSNGAGETLASFTHDSDEPINKGANLNADSLSYRLRVNDLVQNTDSAIQTVTFEPMVFYGPVDNTWLGAKEIFNTITRADLFDLRTADALFKGKVISKAWYNNNGGNIRLVNGTTKKVFVVAVPSNWSITCVTNSAPGVGVNSPLSSNYLNNYVTVNIETFDGQSVPYKIYGASQAVPYPPANGANYHDITLTSS